MDNAVDRNVLKIPCAIIRGGTSKGVFVESKDLPESADRRDRVIAAIFGSPDKRQIDGLGGADPLTSKIAIVSASLRSDADVEYTFGQIGIGDGAVNYAASCGNLPAGIPLFAISRGLVTATDPFTTVRIYNTNTDKLIYAGLATRNGVPLTEGEYAIDGVPGTSPEIKLFFMDPAASITPALLPTGRVQDSIRIGSSRFQVSIVDAGMLYAFLRADEFGYNGCESPIDLQHDQPFMSLIASVRESCSALLYSAGMIGTALRDNLSRYFKVAVVGAPRDYKCDNGRRVSAGEIDLVARIINAEKVHKAYAVTGGIALAAAKAVVGTVVNQVASSGKRESARIGHPGGIIEVRTNIAESDSPDISIESSEVSRTARVIMDGIVYVKHGMAP